MNEEKLHDDPPAAGSPAQNGEDFTDLTAEIGGSSDVVIIGAGCAGLSAIKALKDAGISPICLEMGSKVGGLWVLNNDNQCSAAYESLRINTSRSESEFSEFPLPASTGDYPTHAQMAEYFRAYAEKFDLLSHIRFQHEVVRCTPCQKGYVVDAIERATGTSVRLLARALIVANGHHWSPAYPDPNPAAAFTGLITHSHHYRSPMTPVDFSRKRVLVVGMGNSAMDIASELAQKVEAKVSVSARRGVWVLPRYLRGKPLDQGTIIPRTIPGKLRRRMVTAGFVALHGKMESYGLPAPDHLIGEAHPTVSSEFPGLVKTGIIKMRAGIKDARGSQITFTDDFREDFDAIVFCTGYDVKFPFFAPEHLSAPDNEFPLYHRIFHPEHRHVFFVGLAQTLGAIMPVAEAQSRAIAAHLSGTYNLPSKAEITRRIQLETRLMKERFVASKRHSMQVDPPDFHQALKRDLAQGAERSRRNQGIRFPGSTSADGLASAEPDHKS